MDHDLTDPLRFTGEADHVCQFLRAVCRAEKIDYPLVGSPSVVDRFDLPVHHQHYLHPGLDGEVGESHAHSTHLGDLQIIEELMDRRYLPCKLFRFLADGNTFHQTCQHDPSLIDVGAHV